MPESLKSVLTENYVDDSTPATKYRSPSTIALAAAVNGDPDYYAGQVLDQAKRDNWDWSRLESGLKEYGLPTEPFRGMKGQLDLAAARRGKAGSSIGTVQSFRRTYMPFGDVIPESVDRFVERNTGLGKVVGNKGYADAVKKFNDGTATADDLDTIATFERHNQIDEENKKKAGATLGSASAEKFLTEVGGLSKFAGEMVTGGAAARGVVGAGGRLGRAAGVLSRPAAAATGSAVVPAVPGLAPGTGAYLASRVVPTVVTPAMWVPLMQQNNVALKRDPNDLRGAPAALGYAYATNLVLGKLQKGWGDKSLGRAALAAPFKGAAGLAELQIVDTTAGLWDKWADDAYKVKPSAPDDFGTVGSWVKGHKAGGSGLTDALEHSTIQALAFGAFGLKHRAFEGPQKADPFMQSYADAYAGLRKTGLTKDSAAEHISYLHDVLKIELDNRADLTREEAAQILAAETKDSIPAVKEYAKNLAMQFKPRETPPQQPAQEPVQQPADANKPPEPVKPTEAPAAPVVTPEGVKEAVAASEKVAAAATPEVSEKPTVRPVDSKAPGGPVETRVPDPVVPAAEPAIAPQTNAPSEGGAVGPIALGKASPGGRNRTGKMMDGTPIFRHEIVGEDGKSVGHMEVFEKGDTVKVDWIGLEGSGVGNAGDFAGKLGSANVRKLVRDFAAAYPGATYIEGLRTTGARTGKEKADQRTKVRLPGRKGPERRTEDRPADPATVADKGSRWTEVYESMKGLVGEETARQIADKEAAAAAAPAAEPVVPAGTSRLQRVGGPGAGAVRGERGLTGTGRLTDLRKPAGPAREALAATAAEAAFERATAAKLGKKAAEEYARAVSDAVLKGEPEPPMPERRKRAGAKKPVPSAEPKPMVPETKPTVAAAATPTDTNIENARRSVDTADGPEERVRALGSAWLYNARRGNAAAVAEIEKWMAAEGMKPVGTEGATVPFDGTVHESESAVSDGRPVEVTRRGWAHPLVPGEAVQRALVVPLKTKAGAKKAAPAEPAKTPAFDPEVLAAERKVRAERDNSSLSGDQLAGTVAYDKARDTFVDELVKAAVAEPDAELRDQAAAIVWNLPGDRVAGGGGWKSVAGGRTIQEYGAWEFRSDLDRVAGGRIDSLLAEGKAELAKRLADLVNRVSPKGAPEVGPDPAVAAAATPKPPAEVPKPEAGTADDAEAFRREERRAAFQDHWDEMSPSMKAKTYSDPAGRKALEEAGVDFRVTEVNGKLRFGPKPTKVGFQDQDVSGSIAKFTDQIAANDAVLPREAQALDLYLSGHTLDSVRDQMGLNNKTTTSNYIKRAFQKMKRFSTEWDRWEDATAMRQEFIDKLAEERAEAKKGRSRVDRAATVEDRGVEDTELKRVMEGDEPGALFGGLPFRFLEGLLKGRPGSSARTLGQRLGDWWRGGFNEVAKVAKEQELDQKAAAYAFDVANADKDLRAAVLKHMGGRYQDLGPDTVRSLNYLLQAPADGIAGAARIMNVPPEVAAAVRAMREGADKLEQLAIDSDVLSGPVKMVFEANNGVHLVRAYKVFDPNLAPAHIKEVLETKPEIVNAFKNLIRDQIKEAEKIDADDARLDGEVNKYLYSGTAADSPIAFFNSSKVGATDLSILKKRGDVPPELRALWGEIEDPIANYAIKVAKLSHLIHTRAFQDRLVREGTGKFLFEKPNGDFYEQMAKEGDTSMGPLGEMYATKEFAAAFREQFAPREVNGTVRAWMKMVAAAKFSKIVASHTGRLRDLFSNSLTALRNGHWRNPAAMKKALTAIFDDTPAGREYWRRGIELGVLGEDLSYNDFRATVADAFNKGARPDATGRKDLFETISPLLKGVAKKGVDVFHYVDAIAKINGYEHEKADYRKAYPEWSERQVEEKAAELVRAQYHTYSQLGAPLRALRRALPVAPFVSFAAETVRTTKNTMLQAWREMADPRTRAIGAKRFAGLAAAATLSAAGPGALAMMMGVSAAEDDAARRMAPEYQKNSRLWYTGRNDKGELTYIDGSRTDPHAYLTDALMAFVRDPGVNGAAEAAGELGKPFTSEELLVRPALDIARNQKEPGGRVYNEADPGWDPKFRPLEGEAGLGGQAGSAAGHFGKAFLPGAYPPLRRLGMAVTGQTEDSGRGYTVGQAVAENTLGQREQTIDRTRALEGKIRSYGELNRQAVGIVNRLKSQPGAVTEEQLMEAFKRQEEGRAKALDELRKDVRAAEALGATPAQTRKMMKDLGMSEADIRAVVTGVVAPNLPEFPAPGKGGPEERERVRIIRAGAAKK